MRGSGGIADRRTNRIVVWLCAALVVSLAWVVVPPRVATATGGTFTAAPFNGMQIDYDVTGADLGVPREEYDDGWMRFYPNMRIESGELVVSGQARIAQGFGADLYVTIWMENDVHEAHWTLAAPPASQDFHLAVPIPAGGARWGNFGISLVGYFAVAQDAVRVAGRMDFVPTAPTPRPARTPVAGRTPTPAPAITPSPAPTPARSSPAATPTACAWAGTAVADPLDGSVAAGASRDVAFVEEDGRRVASLGADTSYVQLRSGLVDAQQGTILVTWRPPADLLDLYARPHADWKSYGTYAPPATGFVFDTVGWGSAGAGAFVLWVAPGSAIQAEVFDGHDWATPTWYPAAGEFDWGPVEHELGITWGPSGVGLIVDCVIRAAVPYDGGLDTSIPWYLGQGPNNEPYGPHTLVGTYRDLRVLGTQPDLAGIGQPTPPPQPTPAPGTTTSPSASPEPTSSAPSVSPVPTPGAAPSGGPASSPAATSEPPGFADACVGKGGRFHRDAEGYGCALPDGTTIDCADWSTCTTGTAGPGATASPRPSPDSIVLDVVGSGAVKSKPRTMPTFKLSSPWVITSIETRHWNRGRGAAPGTIWLTSSDGTVYGPWEATGVSTAAGVANAYWRVEPDVVLPPGTYTVVDSEQATWSQSTGTKGVGYAEVRGHLSTGP